MTLKDKIIFGAVVVVVAIIAIFAVQSSMGSNGRTPTLGAVGNMLAENYIPYVRTNGGYNSADPMTISGLFTASGGVTLSGANTLSGATSFTSTAKFGSSGNAITQYNFGKCAILAYATTIAASTTATVDCSTTGRVGGTLTGITSTDNVMAMATTSLSTTYLGVRIVSANTSTTAGYITLKIWNGTGKAFTWTATASSTIAYQAVN